ncbi:histidinol-phosphate transaminase [Macrococcoides caseolyticum]|uniref:histidinol-phosphate transaminase n=1 Tax=Macrococcoides caseolyticum TaxID=69966 RepID=UPI001F38AC72|nr:histidinol-phosphate transaminase [Macrococcus caseolyticus]MCE4955875.1 histidinol-phosphate transaminase [Macrococcus caseolyticus]
MKPQLKSISPYTAGMSEAALKRKTGYTGTFSRLASNENPLGPTPNVQEALKTAIHGLNYYPDPEALQLKEKLSKFYHVPVEQIFIGAGLDEVILSISRAMLIPEGEVLTSEGTFIQYSTHAHIEGITLKTVPLKDGYFDLVKMAEAVTEKTTIIWICNPNNPTGTYVSEKDLKAFLNNVPKEITVVLDEAYFEFVEATDYPDGVALLNEYPNLIVLRTFSKAYGLAALRVGYALTTKAYVEILNKVKLPFNVTTLSLALAETALEDQDYLKQYIKHNQKERQWLLSQPYAVHCLPSQTNFIFIKTSDPQKLFDTLLQYGVISRPMPSGVRVTIGTEDDNQKIDKALKTFFNI